MIGFVWPEQSIAAIVVVLVVAPFRRSRRHITSSDIWFIRLKNCTTNAMTAFISDFDTTDVDVNKQAPIIFDANVLFRERVCVTLCICVCIFTLLHTAVQGWIIYLCLVSYNPRPMNAH